MPSTYSDLLRLEKQAAGENDSTWGDKANTVFEMIEDAIANWKTVVMVDANYTLTTANSAPDEARCMGVNITSSVALTAIRNVVCPASTKLYVVKNATTGGQSIGFKTNAGTGITIRNGRTVVVLCDGVNVVTAQDALNAMIEVNDANGNEVLKFGSVGAAVNEVTVTNAATGSGPIIAPTGNDADIDLNLNAKGAGKVRISGNIPDAFASGTRMIFQQTSAPTGWTKEVSATYNDAALRMTTGVVGTGGADAFTTHFGTSKSTANYTLLSADVPVHGHGTTESPHGHGTTESPHAHTQINGSGYNGGTGHTSNGYVDESNGGNLTNLTSNGAVTGLSVNAQSTGLTINNSGGGGAHAHTLNNFNIKFVDHIIAQKN
jgi:hypothetical protein